MSHKTETKTDDQLIAEFMEFKKNVFEPEFYCLPPPYNSNGPFCSSEFLHFSTSWDWLMPVVHKIAEYRLVYPRETGWVCDCKIIVYQWALYREVVNFIKWFNTHGN